MVVGSSNARPALRDSTLVPFRGFASHQARHFPPRFTRDKSLTKMEESPLWADPSGLGSYSRFLNFRFRPDLNFFLLPEEFDSFFGYFTQEGKYLS